MYSEGLKDRPKGMGVGRVIKPWDCFKYIIKQVVKKNRLCKLGSGAISNLSLLCKAYSV